MRAPSEPPEGALFAEGAPVALRAWPPTDEVLAGDCAGPEEVRRGAAASAPVVAHDAKALGVVPAGLAHDTLLGAYLLEPARRGYPFAELCEERGIGQRPRGPRWRAGAVLLGALADWQREQIDERGPASG